MAKKMNKRKRQIIEPRSAYEASCSRWPPLGHFEVSPDSGPTSAYTIQSPSKNTTKGPSKC